jgi:hypothetical protein
MSQWVRGEGMRAPHHACATTDTPATRAIADMELRASKTTQPDAGRTWRVERSVRATEASEHMLTQAGEG